VASVFVSRRSRGVLFNFPVNDVRNLYLRLVDKLILFCRFFRRNFAFIVCPAVVAEQRKHLSQTLFESVFVLSYVLCSRKLLVARLHLC